MLGTDPLFVLAPIMTHAARGKKDSRPKAPRTVSQGKIHPVVIYPFRQPKADTDLQALYELVARLAADASTYARPITVIDRKTHFANEKNPRYLEFRKKTVAEHSEILDAWCVDTCQMWYSGLGMAFEQGGPNDVYWLIPGDFNYGCPAGKGILGHLHDLPEICVELQQDLCIGEIATDHNNPKHLIDTYGTYALLYNWFPTEAKQIRELTERPRSEFFAIRHGFLGEVLKERWFAYEQTVVMLLMAVAGHKPLSRFFVGDISDLHEGGESLASAIQQVERTERVLKTLWRLSHQNQTGWTEQFRLLEAQSEQIRRSALGILENLLS